MNHNYTAVVKKEKNYWIGWIAEVPGVNCQEKSHDELIKTLKVTLKETLEFNRQEAISAAQTDYKEELVCL